MTTRRSADADRPSSADHSPYFRMQVRSNLGYFRRPFLNTWPLLAEASQWLAAEAVGGSGQNKHWPRFGFAHSVPASVLVRPGSDATPWIASLPPAYWLFHHEGRRGHLGDVCDNFTCRREASERFQHFQGKRAKHVSERVCQFPGTHLHIYWYINRINSL